jgi:hypothetical protein
MTIEGILLGLFALAIGAAFCFWGLRFFLILLPIWGFFAGFLFGAGGVAYLLGEGFLATVLGLVVGFVVGIVFAILSYLYYYVAVVLLGASVGYALGLGLMHWLNNGGGLLAFSVALVGAIIVAGLVVILRVPKYLIVVLTALGGGLAMVYGVALIFNVIPVKDADGGDVSEAAGGFIGAFSGVNLGWAWVLAGLVIGVIGAYYQMRTTAELEELAVDSYRNPGMSGPTGPPTQPSPY